MQWEFRQRHLGISQNTVTNTQTLAKRACGVF